MLLSPQNLCVKLLTFEDCQEASRLHHRVFFKGWSERTFHDFLISPDIFTLKVEQNSTMQGYMIWQEMGEEAEILTLAIDPSHQRKGLGSLLLKSLFEHLKKKNVTKVFLEVAEDNESGILFYKNHGFTFLRMTLPRIMSPDLS